MFGFRQQEIKTALGADHLIRGGGAMVFPSGSNFFFDSKLKRTIFFTKLQFLI